MKRLMLVVMLLAMVALSGCTSSTQYGDCVGLGEDQNPHLKYKISAWNLAMGIIFFELIAPPIFVVVDETYCPVGTK